ncbi:MAG: SDR family oxidoreductase [Desulfobacteraceae bacterium]|nr:SDR family oxidoreductase [Desulfobacteraceae bacterium]
MDYGPHNIRCNAVCSGATRTKMLANSLSPLGETLNTDVDDVFSHLSAAIPLRRVARPEEVTGICSYPANDESSRFVLLKPERNDIDFFRFAKSLLRDFFTIC